MGYMDNMVYPLRLTAGVSRSTRLQLFFNFIFLNYFLIITHFFILSVSFLIIAAAAG